MKPFVWKMRENGMDLLILEKRLPRDLAKIVMSYLKFTVVPWDAFDLWYPEYNLDGDYGHLPQVETGLPMMPLF